MGLNAHPHKSIKMNNEEESLAKTGKETGVIFK